MVKKKKEVVPGFEDDTMEDEDVVYDDEGEEKVLEKIKKISKPILGMETSNEKLVRLKQELLEAEREHMRKNLMNTLPQTLSDMKIKLDEIDKLTNVVKANQDLIKTHHKFIKLNEARLSELEDNTDFLKKKKK